MEFDFAEAEFLVIELDFDVTHDWKSPTVNCEHRQALLCFVLQDTHNTQHTYKDTHTHTKTHTYISLPLAEVLFLSLGCLPRAMFGFVKEENGHLNVSLYLWDPCVHVCMCVHVCVNVCDRTKSNLTQQSLETSECVVCMCVVCMCVLCA